MAKKQTSFERVMSAVEEHYRAQHGTVTGAKAWLARELGVTRQNLDRIKNQGRFPAGYLAKISESTGIPVPKLQGDVMDYVIDCSRKWRLSIRDAELVLIRLGLDNLDRK